MADDPVAARHRASRRRAERLERQGDHTILAGQPGASAYLAAQRILLPKGVEWLDEEEFGLRVAVFGRIQEKLWPLGPDGRLQDRKQRHLYTRENPKLTRTKAKPKAPPGPSAAYAKFLKSMQIDYEKWHGGTGYDLASLGDITAAERKAVVEMLGERLEPDGDWRDIEALAAIGTPDAQRAMKRALRSTDQKTRFHAATSLIELGVPVKLDKIIAEVLKIGDNYDGLSLALDLAAEHPTPYLHRALHDCALNGTQDARISAAALLLYLGGRAAEPFDWTHRPFFLRFGEDDRGERLSAYRELCQRIGSEPVADTTETRNAAPRYRRETWPADDGR